MTEILSLKHVSKVYDNRVQALYDVSFDVRQGELISIIGPSGAGKSDFALLHKRHDRSQRRTDSVFGSGCNGS